MPLPVCFFNSVFNHFPNIALSALYHVRAGANKLPLRYSGAIAPACGSSPFIMRCCIFHITAYAYSIISFLLIADRAPQAPRFNQDGVIVLYHLHAPHNGLTQLPFIQLRILYPAFFGVVYGEELNRLHARYIRYLLKDAPEVIFYACYLF